MTLHFMLSLLLTLASANQNPSPQEGVSLEELEKIALERNPTLAQAGAGIRSAQGRSRQAGAFPNPIIGVTNDDLSYGPVIRGGEWGVFVEQTIVLGRKLGLSRRSAEQEVIQAQAEAEGQRLRVMNSIRALFYRALAAQQKVEIRERLAALYKEAVTTTRQLSNVGQADMPDVLEIEIEEQEADLALISARNEYRQIWTELSAMLGDAAMPMRPVSGDLAAVPPIDGAQLETMLLRDSPEIKSARADISRAEFALQRARREPVPDIRIRAGIHYNRELLEVGGRPIGTQGSLEIGIALPLFNRNQGGVESARADLDRAQREVERVSLSLRTRFAAAVRSYQDSQALIQKYRDQVLPRAQRSYDLYLASFRQMAAAYPQALIAQRTVLQLQEDYVDALANAWLAAVRLQGLLLEGGLETMGFSERRPDSSSN